MKTIIVTFEVSVERNANDMTEEELKKDVKRMLHVYGRSNGLCVENVKFDMEFKGLENVSMICRGIGCALKSGCLRNQKWLVRGGGTNFFYRDDNTIDHCDAETRDCYFELKSDEP
mgnify:CR=1 FL=1